ncbi:MAG: calcium-binding protein, partial [Myxococcota bacterium]
DQLCGFDCFGGGTSADDDTLDAGDGVDLLEGDGGEDTCDGGAGNDAIYGGTGDDVCIGSTGADTLYGEDGNDTLRGGGDNDTLYGGLNSDLLCGGPTSGAGSDALYAVDAALTQELPNAVDTLWEPATSNAPTGGGTQTGDLCGKSTFTPGWAGSSCSYSLTTQPAGC